MSTEFRRADTAPATAHKSVSPNTEGDPNTVVIDAFHFATKAEVDTARGYLRACVEQNPNWEPEHSEEIDALTHEQVIDRTLRLWPHGWDDFRTYFAGDIRDAQALERTAWLAEAAQAARGHLFASRMPAAALRWGQCSRTATEAVIRLGADIIEMRRCGSSWPELADMLDVPVPVAKAWALETHARHTARVVLRSCRIARKDRTARAAPQT